MNRSEQFVYEVCRKSFLSVWSYANPRGKDNKELCDILIVFDPHIFIISVKDIELGNSGDAVTDWKRWQKRAVEKSAQQIYGAERWIEQISNVIRKDGSEGLPFPPKLERRVHRISVSIGGRREVPIMSGEYGKGYVHVFDEISFRIVLHELDTISDFVRYFSSIDNLRTTNTQIFVEQGGEEDVLAFYLLNERSFPDETNLLIIEGGLWDSYSQQPEYRAKTKADSTSYVWDEIIEFLGRDFLDDSFEISSSPNENELVIRVMAQEDRFARRLLGKHFLDFINQWGVTRSRIISSPSGKVYVFLSAYEEDGRKYLIAELAARCFIARGLNPNCRTVIGILYLRSKVRDGSAMALFYFNKENWADEDQAEFDYLRQSFGYFQDPRYTHSYETEYPPM